MKQSSLIKLAVAAALASVAAVGSATTTTTTFGVSAQVNATCLIDSASALTFPAYTPGTGDQAATSTITVRCTNGTSFNIGLNAGTTSGATVANRIMTSGSNQLSYSLYQDAQHASVWGNTPTNDTVNGTGAGMTTANAITKTVYGKVPDQPNAVPGSYADTVTVTVTF
ncbi:spore coat U domain-containing protein [Burkholderia oklahomensis]|uniref:Spore Coat Protein U domain protein n=1 Tax=Burkholderia oklahomensis TaxID=342113 RepID=A0AAI8FPN1_9BURK|nr:spore coat U domain-containing protein [Burkholderia oklahomensis]AIO68105.1 spore Coat Protein U domain protein [Burkholderia oklahomensis]AJX31969.1 spore Coat Protein U domain protein [Burkholderia oklahomensis C6786]AOI41610.1 spore coat protein [Burkholderia oklahomensis EO147]AOI45197.1 spore coat protein [Burkholderia oklahomensis C6786]KUY59500.1 spore coat protein [Burkholderia oklahomensis C6786]